MLTALSTGCVFFSLLCLACLIADQVFGIEVGEDEHSLYTISREERVRQMWTCLYLFGMGVVGLLIDLLAS